MTISGPGQSRIARTTAALGDIDTHRLFGRVAAVRGLLVEIAGPVAAMQVGGRIELAVGGGEPVSCEVIGFSGERALAMPFGSLQGVRRGCEAAIRATSPGIRPSSAWLGHVVDGLGRPVDGRGPLPAAGPCRPGEATYPFRADPPPAHSRRRLEDRWISIPGHQRAPLGVAHHAAVVRPCFSRQGRQGASGARHLCRYGGADPPRRLSGRGFGGGRRGRGLDATAEGLPRSA